jgi:6,7-dimethyl-8-ribityllumazine synthase
MAYSAALRAQRERHWGRANPCWCCAAPVVDSIRLSKDQGVDAGDVAGAIFTEQSDRCMRFGARIPGTRFASFASKLLFATRALATTPSQPRKFCTMAKKKSGAGKRGKQNNQPRMLIVEARFYEHIADALLAGARRVLDEAGASYDCITVPGALEVPAAIVMATEAAKVRRAPYDGVVALGCVIQGETYHFELVSNESARGLMDLSTQRQLAIGNGILTVDTEAQALARSTIDGRNKGAGAARAALAMVALKRKLASQ